MMEPTQDLLSKLAGRIRLGDSNARHTLQQELEHRLVPMIRCVLRSGAGVPALVDWVRGRVAECRADSPEPLDPYLAAPRFAKMLCAGLVRDLPSCSAKETIRGR